MRIIALLAAALAATLAVPASAAPLPAPDAQRTAPPGQAQAQGPGPARAQTQTRETRRTVRRTTTVAHDQRRNHGRRMYWRRSCTTKWRNHHRVRVCRKVRAWR